MATIGDPLADIGYLLMHWTEPGDRLGKFNLNNVTLQTGFPHSRRAGARYEQRSGRSMQALDWYVTLALWKAVVFMEGNYKRATRRVDRRPVSENVRRGRGRNSRPRRGGVAAWPLRTGATGGCSWIGAAS